VSPSLLILRPEPGASETAARAAALGITTAVAPLFRIVPLAWEAPPASEFDAVLLTSANAVRHGGAALGTYRDLPVYSVGAATAAAARAIGFRDVHAGGSDAEALVAHVVADRRERLLHLAGREHRAIAHPEATVATRIVYADEPLSVLPDGARSALAGGAIALLHSPRAAHLFRTLAEAAGFAPATLRIAAISPAAQAAAGDGWAAARAAAVPTDAALLDTALRLCDQRAREEG
jgi:uroporphyrinogen-III synthase